MKRRGSGKTRYSGISIFSTKIQCEQCGSWFGSKVWHSNDKYRRAIYRCNGKYKNHCTTKHLSEDAIKQYFVDALNQIVTEKDEIISNLQLVRQTICDTSKLAEKRENLQIQLTDIIEQTEKLVAENARKPQNQIDYNNRYFALVDEYNSIKQEYDETCTAIEEREYRTLEIDTFIEKLNLQDSIISDFDEKLWCSLVEKMTVGTEVHIIFKDGTII